MSASIATFDIARLMTEPTASLRAEVAEKIAADLSGRALTPAEVQVGHDIVRILARDLEESVRTALSRGLRHAHHLPRDIARRLAEDVEQVALPILTDSIVLTDDDLLDIVRGGSGAKQEAIAGRLNLTESVADSLVIHGGEPAVARLMGNRTAAIAEDSFNRAITRFAESNRVKEAMVLRDRLPPTVAERLVTMVSTALQAHLVHAHDLAAETVSNIVSASREHAIIRLSQGASDEDLLQMAMQMDAANRLTPSLLIRALYTGDVAFFEAAMAAKADVQLGNARILIHEASRRGLEGLYRKASMPPALYNVVRAAVEVADEMGFTGAERDLERFRSRVITRVLALAETAGEADADNLLDNLWEVLICKNLDPI
jgi:uncharacterized protein (DUF2336 family)